MKKRVMVVGRNHCGKTSLIGALTGSGRSVRYTQDVCYTSLAMDVPGAYLENPSMYQHLISLSQEASFVLLLAEYGSLAYAYPPNFAGSFNCPVIGVMTKMDLKEGNTDVCREQWKRIGVREPYFTVSVKDGTGINGLKNYLSLST